jgi:hypothetical protein
MEKISSGIAMMLLFLVVLTACPGKGRGETREFADLVNKNEISDLPLVAQLDHPPARQWRDEDLQALARTYRAIGDRAVNFSPEQLKRLREINPDMIIIKYISAVTIHGKGRARKALERYPEAVLYDEDGNPEPPLWNRRGKGILFDPAHPIWRKYLISEIKAFIKKGYDGAMLDETLMVNTLSRKFTAINPRSGKIYSSDEFRQDIYTCLQSIREAIGDKALLIANSVAYGEKYFARDPRHFLTIVDGVVAEGFRGPAHWPCDKLFRGKAWKNNVDMLVDVEKRGKHLIATVKLLKKQWESFSKDKQDRIALFHICSFLMGKGEKNCLGLKIFDEDDWRRSYRLKNPLAGLELGPPLGNYQKKDGVYQRDFRFARVFVNPSKQNIYLVLKGNFMNRKGEKIESLQLPPGNGEILLKP